VVELAAPVVGPAPASRDASNFVIFSISVVHGPAPAVPIGKTTSVQAPSSKAVVFMALSPGCVVAESRMRISPFDNQPGLQANVPRYPNAVLLIKAHQS
jgi:hypothetical protein